MGSEQRRSLVNQNQDQKAEIERLKGYIDTLLEQHRMAEVALRHTKSQSGSLERASSGTTVLSASEAGETLVEDWELTPTSSATVP